MPKFNFPYIFVQETLLKILQLTVPGLIVSDFFQTFGDMRRKLIFFSLPLVNFTAENLYRLEDINEIVICYGNHNYAYKVLAK